MGIKITIEAADIESIPAELDKIARLFNAKVEPVFKTLAEGEVPLSPVPAEEEAPAPPLPAAPVPDPLAPVAPIGGAATTPAATGPAAGGNGVGAPVDNTGRAWDERIDAKNRGTNADGTWRKRRGVDMAYYNQVLAELAGQQAPAPAAVAPPVAPVTPEGPGTLDTIALGSKILAAASTEDELAELSMAVHGIMVNHGLAGGANDLLQKPELCPVVHADLVAYAAQRGIQC